MSEILKDIAVVIMVTVLLTGWAFVVATLDRMLRNARQPRTPTSYFTLRISNIPKDISEGRFKSILKDLPIKMSTSYSAADRPELLGWSFARSGHSERSVATATFQELAPSELESVLKCKIAGSAQLRVDSDFFGLTPLTDPQDPAVDIVAVSGLASHAYGSWKARNQPYMWLRDFLPESIPNARILIYGYDTKLPGSQSTASILELSRKLLESVKTIRSQQQDRPLIFIGHSLGGLVVKQALVQAAEGSSDDQGIFRSCYAVMLFGVPNKGLDISSLRSMVRGQPNEDLVENLKSSSPLLSHLHELFYNKFILEDSQIICIFETKKTTTVEWSPNTRTWERAGRKVMMVSRDSAIYVGKNEKSYNHLSIDADHSDIVKFSDPSNSDYVVVKSRIERLVCDAPIVIRKRFMDHKRRLMNTENKYVKALNAPDYVFFREFQVDNPEEGTFQWILRDKLIDSWLSKNESSLLWIKGSPGQGKTVLSKFLLNHLDSQPTNSPKPAWAVYFFFYNQDERFQTVGSLVRSLIKQLLRAANFSQHVAHILESDPSKESEDSLWETLEEIICTPVLGTIYFVIDALDECNGEESRKRLLRRLKKLLQNSQKGRSSLVMKLLVTSRPTVDIGKELDKLPCMDLKANPGDIEIFIKSKVADLSQFPTQLQENAAELLLNTAGGTFLWVSIVLKNLRKMTTISRARLRTVISEIPTDLDELYSRIIGQILEGDENEQKLLVWVVYGRRPLTLKELEAALATQMNSESWESTEDHRVDPTLLIQASGMSVILETTDDKVHLIHQSAKDFLLRNQQLSFCKFCNELDPNIYLAKVCIVYLSFEDFKSGPCGNQNKLAARKCQYQLYHYAAHNWHLHIQGQDDISGISSFVCQLTEPGSPILLAWGEAADIADLHEATDIWGIATKADILWLAEFQPSDRIISEGKVEEAAEDSVKGYDMIKGLVRRGNVRFTEEAVYAIARNFDQGVMQLLLNKNDDVKVTQGLIEATAANRKSGNFVMGLLLESSDNTLLTDNLIRAAAKNKESGRDIMERLLRNKTVQIEDGTVAAIAKGFDAGIVELLLNGRRDIKITRKVVRAAAENEVDGTRIMAMLLNQQNTDVKITENIAQTIAEGFDQRIMALFLNRQGDEVKITEKILEVAIENWRDGTEMITLLLDRRSDEVKITEEIVIAAIKNHNSIELMILLLDRYGDEVKITEEIVKEAAGNWNNSYQLITLFFDRRGDEMKITKEIMIAAIQGKHNSIELMILLLDRYGDEVKITKEILKAAINNLWNKDIEIIILLLDRRSDEVKITEEIVIAAIQNKRNSIELMTLLLDRYGDEVKITEKILKAAIKNWWNDNTEMIILLLDRRGDEVKITEEIVIAVIKNHNSIKLMILFFDRYGNEVKITEEIVIAAIKNHNSIKLMILLFDRYGNEVKITEEIVKEAAGNWNNGYQLITLFFNRRGNEVNITEEIVKEAAGNWDNGYQLMTLFFDRRENEVKITEEVVKAIAIAENKKDNAEVIAILIGRQKENMS